MTKAERKAYVEWNKKMTEQGDARDKWFKEMQVLAQKHGIGTVSCSLESNLDYLLTSNDSTVRGRALGVYRKYWEASAQYDALLDLAQAFANIWH